MAELPPTSPPPPPPPPPPPEAGGWLGSFLLADLSDERGVKVELVGLSNEKSPNELSKLPMSPNELNSEVI